MRLPVLLYHHVDRVNSEGLTVSVAKLEQHFEFLSKKKYKTHHLKDIFETQKLEGKNAIITFDDAYTSHFEYVYPLLKKYNLKATFFVPVKYIGEKDKWKHDAHSIMNLAQLNEMDPNLVELGYHSFAHKMLTELSLEELNEDFTNAKETAGKNQLNLSNIIAYPYGKLPGKGELNDTFKQLLKKYGFKYGLRIGNRVNRFPFKNPFEIQRLDIKGEYSLFKFKRMLLFGKYL